MIARYTLPAALLALCASMAWGGWQYMRADRLAVALTQITESKEGCEDARDAVADVDRRGAAEWLRDTFGGAGDGDP